MTRYLVVGSGATGVHFAQTLLERGEKVEMLDVGFERPVPPLPDADIDALKDELPDPERYFLGEHGEAVVYPSPSAKPYGFPPSKEYVFQRPATLQLTERGFSPLLSYARGGLAEAWTGGSYELRDEELADFPFTASELRPHYSTVAARIGITASADDIERFSPRSAPYLEPLPMDQHSAELHARYDARRAAGERRRVLPRPLAGRGAQPGAWGTEGVQRTRSLPLGMPARIALRAEPHALRAADASRIFGYRPGLLVSHVVRAPDGRAIGVEATPVGGGSAGALRRRARDPRCGGARHHAHLPADACG